LKTNLYDIDGLLVKHLTGEASTQEEAQVQEWLRADEANQHYFNHFSLIWEESVHLAATTPVNEQEAWERFQQRLQTPPTTQAPVRKIFFPGASWMRIAAVAILAIGLAWMAWVILNTNSIDNNPLTVITTSTNILTDTLPDGSRVTLNKHTELSHPTHFTGQKRNVQLKGEAFFTVTPNKEKPFVIQVKDVTVQVVGTSFNVRNHSDTTEVIVETGVVEVIYQEQRVVLHAGEQVIIVSSSSTLLKQNSIDQLHKYYRNRQFVCDHTPLWRLCEILTDAYDVPVVVDAKLRNELYTGEFNDESLDKILQVVSLSFPFDIHVIKENGQYILR
jgi:transmembrane sensor